MKIKEFLKGKKLITIVLVSLFMFTAFTVIQSGGTNTGSIHSVSPTSILPYTTTSNGLTYTVESNGTYLWNGHYLRDPPVAYPAVPTIAPDGLPYGAVGSVGAQGHLGPYSFTKGTAKIVGVSPNSTLGGVTTINENTYWNNETITLTGNVSVNSNEKLYINDSSITFEEPSSGSYGRGILNDAGWVIFQDGSSLQELNSTGPSMFVTNTYYLSEINFNNTTVTIKDNTSDSGDSSIIYNVFTYSEYNGNNYTGPALFDAGSGVTFPSEMSHSIAKNGYVTIMRGSNNSFIHDEVGLNANANSEVLTYDTLYNFGLNYSKLFGSGSNGIPWMNITHDSFQKFYINNYTYDSNIGGLLTPETNGYFNIFNNSFDGIYAGKNGSTAFPTLFLMGSGSATYHNYNVSHNSLSNIYISGGVGGAVFGGNDNNATFSYNKVNNFQTTVPGLKNGTNTVEFNIFSMSAMNTTVTGNLVENMYATPGVGHYSLGSPASNPQLTFVAISSPQQDSNIHVTHNFFINLTGQAWPIVTYSKSVNPKGFTVSNNTAVNLSSDTFIPVALNTGSNGTLIENNVAYGAYNNSTVYGSLSGGAIGTVYNNNQAYDIDTSSYLGTTTLSRETWNHEDGNFNFIGYNTSNPWNGLDNARYYPYRTTVVTIENSTMTGFVAWGIATGDFSAYDFRSPPTTIYPLDFNFTFSNSYIPSSVTSLAYNMSLFKSNQNPSFLNLTGYLGIYSGQTYILNASNIKNEASLPIYYSGNQVALIPQSTTAHYNFEVSGTQATPNYTISANSKQDAPVTFTWNNLQQSQKYSVNLYNNGGLVTNYTYTAGTNGVITFVYNPATMPVDPTFNLTLINSPSQSTPPPVKQPFDYTKFIVISGGLLAIVALAYYYGKSKRGGSGGYGGRRI